MRIPAALAALLVTLLGGGVAIAGELSMAHPLHQAIVIAAAFVTGLIGLFTTTPAPASSSSERAPPFDIPAALPTPASTSTSAPMQSSNRARPEIPHPPGEQGVG